MLTVVINIAILEIDTSVFEKFVNKSRLTQVYTAFTIITQETPDMDKEKYMKSIMAQKGFWWLVGDHRPPTNHLLY